MCHSCPSVPRTTTSRRPADHDATAPLRKRHAFRSEANLDALTLEDGAARLRAALALSDAAAARAAFDRLHGGVESGEPDRVEIDVAAAEQAKELDAYILGLKQDKTRLQKLLPDDYSSPAAFEKSHGTPSPL